MDVTLHTPDTIYSPRHVPSWLFLAGAAGAVNGVGFLMCEQFVTHVTGTATRLGLEWPVVGLVGEYAAVVLSFVAGAAASVVAIQARAARGQRPRWATPLVSVAALLTGVALAGHAGAFGRFGGSVAADPPPVALLSVLAFAMGLQNAAVASTTGLAVRTTHLTGPATDLGIHLGTALVGTEAVRRAALRGAALRGGKVAAFVVGAAVAVPLARNFGFLALLAPAALVLAAAALSFTTNWSPSDFPFRLEPGRARPSAPGSRHR
ncbi:Uncharacterized protein OS=Bdellovibrio exovorus JSS GN=A11Q_1873 PE=4 SV=1: DUF1275 [Gemmata massiliana]|uniref:DUF1275 domain-containing protein n=1 Tax=Gemmata massiliana TaxID=1210884 RepID=A0A6P2D019_9BACT|nr:YoaK family protein [Gemmata massiliana]VTR92772.1 Uncharacterized protein OS=Bdellovibrio exovorus JSS GN=A11Q_1873 PE=4 SV=1: DUF1275 [Gemmata massiliana]